MVPHRSKVVNSLVIMPPYAVATPFSVLIRFRQLWRLHRSSRKIISAHGRQGIRMSTALAIRGHNLIAVQEGGHISKDRGESPVENVELNPPQTRIISRKHRKPADFKTTRRRIRRTQCGQRECGDHSGRIPTELLFPYP
jgi:hypothetical protein